MAGELRIEQIHEFGIDPDTDQNGKSPIWNNLIKLFQWIEYAQKNHTHEIVDINGLQTILDNIEAAIGGSEETDPVFTAWLNTHPLSSFITSEADPVFTAWLNTHPLSSFLTAETDPIFTTWLNGHPLNNFVQGPPINQGTNGMICVWDGTTNRLIKIANGFSIDNNGQISIVPTTDENGYVVGIDISVSGILAFAASFKSDFIPLQVANMDHTTTGDRIGLVLRSDSAHLIPENEFGIAMAFRMPVKGWSDAKLSEAPGGYMICRLSDVTIGSEDTYFVWKLLLNGEFKERMKLDSQARLWLRNSDNTAWIQIGGIPEFVSSDGSIIINGNDLTIANHGASLFKIILPNAVSVQARCDAVVSKPATWSIGAESGFPNHLRIVHNLNLDVASVTVFSRIGSASRQLFGNPAYSGIYAESKNVLRIENLATIANELIIQILFS